MFDDRADAARQLADALREADIDADAVLAIPRGGLPVGRIVADALDLPLGIAVARKIRAPHNPELALGATGPDGTDWLNDDVVQRAGATDAQLADACDTARQEAEEKAASYRDEPMDLAGKRVVIVDDGAATGATMHAAVRIARERGAAAVVVGLPVAPPDTVASLEAEADAVVCLEQPRLFMAVGQYYDRFDQVSDEEARAALHEDT